MMAPSPNLAVAWCLMASYAYYHCDTNIMSDQDYDHSFLMIQVNYDKINHPHLHLIEKGSKTTSMFDIPVDDYPGVVKFAVDNFLKKRKSNYHMLGDAVD